MRHEDTGSRVVGVDGCPWGWFAVARLSDDRWAMGMFQSIVALHHHFRDARRILVDIPIGLPDEAPRECDRLARRRLPPGRRSSVFAVPLRAAVFARDYAGACAENARVTGKRFSRQAWNICPKIREMDQFLRQHPGVSAQVQESHPELCFAHLGSQPRGLPSKKTAEGRRVRLDILSACWPVAQTIYSSALERYPRRWLAADDILDAMVLAQTAAGPLRGVMPQSEYDAMGLPMQIVFPDYAG